MGEYTSKNTKKIVVTKELPGQQWRDLLISQGFTLTIFEEERVPTREELYTLIGERCFGVIGQLSESWDRDLLERLARAGGRVLATYAVGYNNVDVESATDLGIAVCNTPGVLTESTAEMGVALTFAAARRVVEGDTLVRGGHFKGWLPKLNRGRLLHGKTLGLIGAGRIGSAYGEMMVMGHAMHCLYSSPSPKRQFEERLRRYHDAMGHERIVERVEELKTLLERADLIALFPPLTPSTHHLINSTNLQYCKPNAILVNLSRGPVVDEQALVAHLKAHPRFYAGLDVFEREPELAPELADLPNVVLTPHTGSATYTTREEMSLLCARNVLGVYHDWEVYDGTEMVLFVTDSPPDRIPSRINTPR